MDIKLKNISKRYNKDVCVIKDFSLTLESGKLTSLLGPSGCGKTTILNIISGVIAPSSGEVYFGEKEVTNVSIRDRNIGYVFQRYSLYPNMTVYENIKFPLTNIKYPRGFNKKAYFDEEIHSIAKLLKIEDLLKRKSHELSGGQKQRVAIARALVRKPEILLMDEPFANLDKKLSVILREDIRRIQQSLGITTVFVTHNQSDANAISDKIVVMNNGEIQQQGTSMELYTNPSSLFVADFFSTHEINVLEGFCEDGNFICGDIVLELPVRKTHNIIKYVAFRPEDVSCGDENYHDFVGVVKSAVYEGDRFLYTIELSDKRYFVYLNSHINIGEKVYIILNKNKMSFFDCLKKRVVL